MSRTKLMSKIEEYNLTDEGIELRNLEGNWTDSPDEKGESNE